MTTDDRDPPREEPVLPRGKNGSNREFAGCLIVYALIAIEFVGLPIIIIYGLVSGDWRPIIPWLIIAVTVFVLGRLNLIPIFGD